jgi:hypothetical protein
MEIAETEGFLAKTCGQGGQTDLICRIKIWRLRWVRAANSEFDRRGPGLRLTRPVESQSNDPVRARARLAAVTGSERRSAAARGGCGAGVPHLPRGSRREDGELTANSKAGSRGGGEDSGRRTVTGRGGANPGTSPRRSGARR